MTLKITPLDIQPDQYMLPEPKSHYCDSNRAIPFLSNEFDLCFAIEIIEHLHDPKNLILEAFRVFKPSGLLYLTTPSIQSLALKLRFLFTGQFQWFRENDF